MLRGSCLCGDVRWEISGKLELISHCHCSICRKSHGAAFGTYAMTRPAGFRWISGREGIRQYESSPDFTRPFCGRCGSVVGEAGEQRGVTPVGPLEGAFEARPLAHIFTASKAPWHQIAGSLPRFDAYPPDMGYEAPKLAPRTPLDLEPGSVGGRCACGAVAYAVEGGVDLLINCHCSRCRRARAAAHATNGFVPRERFRWLRGEEQLERFELPEAERFTQVFCPTCGSPMPVVRPEAPRVVIPAGSLEGDPGGRERAPIFCGSKSAWSDIEDDLPQFEAYSDLL